MEPKLEEEPILVSATQIEMWEDCHRKWGFKYLERIQVSKHPAAILGTEVQDEQIDPYLATGRNFDFTRPSGEIAQQLVPLLPPSKPRGTALREDGTIDVGLGPATERFGLKLRRKFLIPSPRGGFGYQGEFDLWAPKASCVPGLESSELQLLGDIKTTGNLKYAKDENKLRTDVQAQLYATVVMVEENVDELDLVWFYTKTKKAYRAQRTHLRIGASHVVEQFQRIDAVASELVAMRKARPSVDELKPNPRMCEAYGGCPFRHRCNLSPPVHAAAVNQEALSMTLPATTNNFLDGLRKPAAAPAFAPPVQAAPEALPPWATAPVDPLHRAPAAAVAPVGPVAVTSFPMAAPAINPPESALPPASPVGAAAPVPATAPAEAPKRRGRPPKAATENVAASAPGISGSGFPFAEAGAFLHALAAWIEGGAS